MLNHEQRVDHKQDASVKKNLTMLAMNGLDYDAPVSSSSSVDRIKMNFPFNPQSYQGVSPSTSCSVIFNTGSNFINPSTSSVIFTLNFPNAPADLCWSFGNNFSDPSNNNTLKSGSSCANLFSQIDLKARGGEYLVRAIDANVLNCALAPFKKGYGSELLFGECGGASLTVATMAPASSVYAYPSFRFPVYWATDSVSFEIPLSRLVPGSFFSERSPLPPTVISGATLTLTCDNFLRAMTFYKASTGKPAGNKGKLVPANLLTVGTINPLLATPSLALNINNMQLMLDSMILMDSQLSLVNAKASSLKTSGLQVDYYGVFQNKTTLVSQSANIDVMISAGQLKTVIVSFLKPSNQADGTFDALARLPLYSYGVAGDGAGIFLQSDSTVGLLGSQGASCRLRIGSQYTTLVPQTSAGQTYRYTYESLCDITGGLIGDVDALKYVNKPIDLNAGYLDWIGGTGCTTIAFDCTKNLILGNANSQTNNSRSAIIEINGLNASAQNPIECVIHCLYLNVCNSSLENNIVDK